VVQKFWEDATVASKAGNWYAMPVVHPSAHPDSAKSGSGVPKPLRILHLLGAHEDSGGILSVIRSLQMATRSTCTHVVWVNEQFVERRRPPLEYRRERFSQDENASHLRLFLRNLRAWPGLRRLLNTESFDVIHAHSRGSFPVAILTALFGDRRCLFTNHTYARRRAMYSSACRFRGIRWVFLTPNMARHYQVEPDPGRIDLVSACCSDDFFDKPLGIQTPATDAGILRIVGVGNIVEWKRWDLSLRALSFLDPELRARLRITIYGPVPGDSAAQAYASKLASLLGDTGLSRQFELAGPTNDIGSVLSQADWFLLPSTDEPCSVALIEALASGVPAIVSAGGGNIDIVREGASGLFFRSNDAQDLSRRFLEIAEGKPRMLAPKDIRETVRSRSATAIGARYLQIYREMYGGIGRGMNNGVESKTQGDPPGNPDRTR
jgi:glycosyltransferase involved in cell wall biosynthesis